MAVIHKSTFPAEAGPRLKRAADAASTKDGVLGYHILSPDFETWTMILIVENEEVFESFKDCDASKELWEKHPPLSHSTH